MLVVTGVMHEADNALLNPEHLVLIITSFLAGVQSANQCLLDSKVLSCFSGVIMSIRSFFLLALDTSVSSFGGRLVR